MLLQASRKKPEYHFAASGNMIEVGGSPIYHPDTAHLAFPIEYSHKFSTPQFASATFWCELLSVVSTIAGESDN
jgi:hypothetical protein